MPIHSGRFHYVLLFAGESGVRTKRRRDKAQEECSLERRIRRRNVKAGRVDGCFGTIYLGMTVVPVSSAPPPGLGNCPNFRHWSPPSNTS